jgi:hypothetical protein
MIIPKGKVITILKNGSDDIMPSGVVLTLDTEVTLSLQSHFEQLIGNTTLKAGTVLSGAIKAFTGETVSGSFKQAGYQIWTGTDPLTFAFSTTLNMKTSALRDVFAPAKILMNLVLPEEASGNGFGLNAPGPTIVDALGTKTNYSKQYSFRCGIIYLPSIIITKAEPTFSDDVDEQGYPIWCTLQIEVSSVFTATTDLINGFNANY